MKTKVCKTIAIICLLFVTIFSFTLAINKNGKTYANSTLIYQVDFSDSNDYGKNVASNLQGASFVNNGGLSFVNDSFLNKTAVQLTSTGVRQNYIKLPSDIFNGKTSVTISYHLKVSSMLPAFSRELEYGNGTNRMVYMPFHLANYFGYRIEKNGVDYAFAGTDTSVQGKGEGKNNLPNMGTILPLYNGWVLRSYVLTNTYFAVYQNGTEILRKSGDFTANQFYSANGYVYLGATDMDATADFSGSFADIRVYEGALTPTEVETEYGTNYTNYITDKWDFENENANNSIRDYHGNLVGNASVKKVDKDGKQVGVLALDGTNSSDMLARTSMTVHPGFIMGHREMTISIDLNISSDISNYARIFEFAVDKTTYMALYAGFGGKANIRFEFTKDANSTREILTNADYMLPLDKWINITVTLGLNNAVLYVDGMPIVSQQGFKFNDGIYWDRQFDNLTSWEGLGIMSFGKTSYFNDSPIIADYDCIEIYSKALTEKEVMQRADIIKTADDKQAVETQANAFVLDYTGGAKIDLPNYVEDGVKVVWSSSDESIISKDGHVYPVTTEKKVSLFAVFSRGNESVSKSYDITLNPFKRAEFDRQIFALKDVQIDQSSFYWEYMMANVDKFMFKLNRDRLLYNFRRICGVDTKGVSTYGGWISPESNGASQFEMHYISALARLTQSMPNYSYNGETASDRLAYMINALKECQENYAKIDPSNAGYVNAFSIENFEVIKTGNKKMSDGTTAWVPWYFMHKTLAGLYDTYTFATDATTRNNAYTVMIGLADWCSDFLLEMNEQEMQNTITVEYGGITEVLYNIYALTGNINYYKAAQCFEETALFEKILKQEDPLSGLHSNTTIPKILGLCAAYEITGEEKYKTIAINFFDMVMQRTYSNGGTSYEEFWKSENQVEEARFVEETCCSYNMLYLTDYLYRWTGDKKYVEYYENVYLNHILSSIDVETGCKTYHVNTQFGYYKVYHTLDTTFWCCSCSGMESYSKLGIHVYYKIKGGVEVNLFTPSTLKYSNDLSIVQSGNYLTDEKTTLKIVGGGNLKLKIRIPDWCKDTYSVKLNNTTIVNPTTENGYVVIERNFENNDTIDFNMPMTYWLKDRLTKGETTSKTLFYGPTMLVADLGPANESQILETMTPNFGAPYSGNIKNYMILDKDLQDCITKSVNGNFMNFTFKANNQTVNFVPFYQAYRIRYGMYLNYYDKTNEKNSASEYNEQDVDFVNIGHADYNSSNLQNVISSNSLKLASEGESKYIITERKIYGRFLTTFDITPSTVGGAINAGLYIHATNAQKDTDKINAFNIHFERVQDSNSLDISIYRFDQAYLGKVSGATITCDTHTISVKVVVSDGYVLVYINNSITPSLSAILDGVKCDGGYIGLRTLYCDVTFSNMLIKANEFDINYKYLIDALQQVQNLNGSLYTQASWSDFIAILNNCKNINDNKTATTQTQVKELANNLLSAKENLVLKSTESSSSSSSSSSVSQAPSSSSSSSSKEESSSSSEIISSSSSKEESSSSSEIVSSSSSQEESSSSNSTTSSSADISEQPQPSRSGCGGNINSCYYLLGFAFVAVVIIMKKIKQKNN